MFETCWDMNITDALGCRHTAREILDRVKEGEQGNRGVNKLEMSDCVMYDLHK